MNEMKFRFWCQNVLPSIYDDSLSYYELLCKVVKSLELAGGDIGTLEDKVDELVEKDGSIDRAIAELVEKDASIEENISELTNADTNIIKEIGRISDRVSATEKFVERQGEKNGEIDGTLNGLTKSVLGINDTLEENANKFRNINNDIARLNNRTFEFMSDSVQIGDNFFANVPGGNNAELLIFVIAECETVNSDVPTNILHMGFGFVKSGGSLPVPFVRADENTGASNEGLILRYYYNEEQGEHSFSFNSAGYYTCRFKLAIYRLN